MIKKNYCCPTEVAKRSCEEKTGNCATASIIVRIVIGLKEFYVKMQQYLRLTSFLQCWRSSERSLNFYNKYSTLFLPHLKDSWQEGLLEWPVRQDVFFHPESRHPPHNHLLDPTQQSSSKKENVILTQQPKIKLKKI